MSTPPPTDSADTTANLSSDLSATTSSLREDKNDNRAESADVRPHLEDEDGGGFAPSITDEESDTSGFKLEGADNEPGKVNDDVSADNTAPSDPAVKDSAVVGSSSITANEAAPNDAGAVESDAVTKASAVDVDRGKSSSDTPMDASEKQTPAATAKTAAYLDEPVAVDTTDADSDLFPLTPVEINQLVERRHKKVMTCYDIARAKTPGLAGTLELKVGMAWKTFATLRLSGRKGGDVMRPHQITPM